MQTIETKKTKLELLTEKLNEGLPHEFVNIPNMIENETRINHDLYNSISIFDNCVKEIQKQQSHTFEAEYRAAFNRLNTNISSLIGENEIHITYQDYCDPAKRSYFVFKLVYFAVTSRFLNMSNWGSLKYLHKTPNGEKKLSADLIKNVVRPVNCLEFIQNRTVYKSYNSVEYQAIANMLIPDAPITENLSNVMNRTTIDGVFNWAVVSTMKYVRPFYGYSLDEVLTTEKVTVKNKIDWSPTYEEIRKILITKECLLNDVAESGSEIRLYEKVLDQIKDVKAFRRRGGKRLKDERFEEFRVEIQDYVRQEIKLKMASREIKRIEAATNETVRMRITKRIDKLTESLPNIHEENRRVTRRTELIALIEEIRVTLSKTGKAHSKIQKENTRGKTDHREIKERKNNFVGEDKSKQRQLLTDRKDAYQNELKTIEEGMEEFEETRKEILKLSAQLKECDTLRESLVGLKNEFNVLKAQHPRVHSPDFFEKVISEIPGLKNDHKQKAFLIEYADASAKLGIELDSSKKTKDQIKKMLSNGAKTQSEIRMMRLEESRHDRFVEIYKHYLRSIEAYYDSNYEELSEEQIKELTENAQEEMKLKKQASEALQNQILREQQEKSKKSKSKTPQTTAESPLDVVTTPHATAETPKGAPHTNAENRNTKETPHANKEINDIDIDEYPDVAKIKNVIERMKAEAESREILNVSLLKLIELVLSSVRKSVNDAETDSLDQTQLNKQHGSIIRFLQELQTSLNTGILKNNNKKLDEYTKSRLISGLRQYHKLYDVEFSHLDNDKFGIDDETILKTDVVAELVRCDLSTRKALTEQFKTKYIYDDTNNNENFVLPKVKTGFFVRKNKDKSIVHSFEITTESDGSFVSVEKALASSLTPNGKMTTIPIQNTTSMKTAYLNLTMLCDSYGINPEIVLGALGQNEDGFVLSGVDTSIFTIPSVIREIFKCKSCDGVGGELLTRNSKLYLICPCMSRSYNVVCPNVLKPFHQPARRVVEYVENNNFRVGANITDYAVQCFDSNDEFYLDDFSLGICDKLLKCDNIEDFIIDIGGMPLSVLMSLIKPLTYYALASHMTAARNRTKELILKEHARLTNEKNLFEVLKAKVAKKKRAESDIQHTQIHKETKEASLKELKQEMQKLNALNQNLDRFEVVLTILNKYSHIFSVLIGMLHERPLVTPENFANILLYVRQGSTTNPNIIKNVMECVDAGMNSFYSNHVKCFPSSFGLGQCKPNANGRISELEKFVELHKSISAPESLNNVIMESDGILIHEFNNHLHLRRSNVGNPITRHLNSAELRFVKKYMYSELENFVNAYLRYESKMYDYDANRYVSFCAIGHGRLPKIDGIIRMMAGNTDDVMFNYNLTDAYNILNASTLAYQNGNFVDANTKLQIDFVPLMNFSEPILASKTASVEDYSKYFVSAQHHDFEALININVINEVIVDPENDIYECTVFRKLYDFPCNVNFSVVEQGVKNETSVEAAQKVLLNRKQ